MNHTSNSNDQLQDIISHVYDAALDQNLWKNIIEILTRMFKAEQGYIRIIETNSNNIQQTYSCNKDHSWVQAFKDYYVHQDPWLNNILKSKNTLIACTHHYMANNEYEKMEYYQDFVRPQKIHYGLGGIIKINKNTSAYLALNRSKEKQGFQNEHLNNLQYLTPHIQKALLINEKTRHIEFENNLLTDTINQINSPLLLVNKKGKILFINVLAEKIIEQQTGMLIINNHIIIQSSKDNNKLQQLIYQAASESTRGSFQQGGTLKYVDPVNQEVISLLISPINPNKSNIDTQEYESALILLNTNQQQSFLSSQLLVTQYKLTKAEARLALHLYQGLTLKQISEKFCLSINTIKTQLRSCFRKLGVSRQAELIRAINTSTY